MPAETYSSEAFVAVRRIRTPHEHDVLSGRGGGINNHVGNQVFRQWVAERKEDYNLAPNKKEKAHVAQEVMDKVRNQNPPGRFLQRDPTVTTGPGWWVEVDEARALTKTSQALREGAPQIRLALGEEVSQRVNKSNLSAGKRKRETETASQEEVSEQPASALPATPPLRPLVEQGAVPLWAQALHEQMANMQQNLQQQMANMQRALQQQMNELQRQVKQESQRSINRYRNSTVEQMVIPVNDAQMPDQQDPPIWFPDDQNELMNATENQLSALLRFYGQDPHGTKVEKQDRLKRFMGVTL